MSNEAQFHAPGEVIQETAAGAVTAGQVEIKAGRLAFATHSAATGGVATWQITGLIVAAFTAVATAAKKGEPVWWDASANTFTITPISAAGDRFGGILAADLAASATSGKVLLNQVNAEIPADIWAGKVCELHVANNTLDAQDAGKLLVYNVDNAVITLPATVAGLELIIANVAADGGAKLSISPNSSDKIMGPDIAGTDDHDQINTKATQKRWDYTRLIGDGSNGWWITQRRGTWAEEE